MTQAGGAAASTAPRRWSAKVLATRRSGRYAVLTVAAPGVAQTARPGQFASARIGTGAGDPGFVLRRQLWILTATASGREGGALDLAVDATEPGSARLAATQPGAAIDLIGPVGRGFSLPRHPLTAVLAGSGAPSAALVWLADELGLQGSRVRFLHLPGGEPFAPLDVKRLATSVITAAPGSDPVAALRDEVAGGAQVVYAAAPQRMLRSIAPALADVPAQVALPADLVCAAGTCTACIVPVVGRDGVARDVRSCIEGPVLPADLVRWAELA